MTPEEKKLVQELEAKYDAFKPKLDRLQEALADFQASYSDYTQLTGFYGSEDWFRLRDLPANGIKSGILSEDQLYHLISDHNELLGELLKISSQMYKHI